MKFVTSEEWAQIKQKERDLDVLAERVAKLEAELIPFRVGELSEHYIRYPYLSGWMPGYDPDPRAKVAVREVIQTILDHLHLRLGKTVAVPERITLEKSK